MDFLEGTPSISRINGKTGLIVSVLKPCLNKRKTKFAQILRNEIENKKTDKSHFGFWDHD